MCLDTSESSWRLPGGWLSGSYPARQRILWGQEWIYCVSSHSSNFLRGVYELCQDSIQLRFLRASNDNDDPLNLKLAVHLHSEGSSRLKLLHPVYHISLYINPPSEHGRPGHLPRRLTRRETGNFRISKPNLDWCASHDSHNGCNDSCYLVILFFWGKLLLYYLHYVYYD